MKIKFLNLFILIAAAAIFVYAFFIHDNKKPLRYLAVYGPKTFESKSGKTDTLFHTIANFDFIDQNGNHVTAENFTNSIYVTDFFFTTCHTICPVMSTQMNRVYEKYKGNNEVKFLSHTVDPEIDTVEQLNRYASKFNANAAQWMFVTGDKKALYEIARTSYFLDAQQGDGGPDDFIHTQNFALIDKDRRIRGYYDGTDSIQIDQLIKDIDILLSEYHYKEKK